MTQAHGMAWHHHSIWAGGGSRDALIHLHFWRFIPFISDSFLLKMAMLTMIRFSHIDRLGCTG